MVSYCQGSYFAEIPGAPHLAGFPARHDAADVTQGQIWRQGRACLVKS
ncbi:MAG: hypothetical protein Q8M95_08015 [Candidatus Methanoperedens sp.]|nr:hypothetical protein [Candidatus Methanoperedens sp.]